MNSTEQKIREAFEKEYPHDSEYDYLVFKKGYMALLNELEPSSFPSTRGMLYLLPEGVEKP